MYELYFWNETTKEEVFFYGRFERDVREQYNLGTEWALVDKIYID